MYKRNAYLIFNKWNGYLLLWLVDFTEEFSVYDFVYVFLRASLIYNNIFQLLSLGSIVVRIRHVWRSLNVTLLKR